MKRQPLLVHLLFHPKSTSACELACHIHQQLNGDILVPGLRVPTVFCPTKKGNRPPPSLHLDFAERNFLVVLADDQLNIDDEWCQFMADVCTQAQPPAWRFVPIQLSHDAWPLDPRLNDLSFAKAHLQPDKKACDAFVVRRIVVELCRYLSNLEAVENSEFEVPVTLFLSHAKADIDRDPKATRCFIDALKADQPVEAWVDSGDIASGSRFAESIERGVQRSSLLAVLTDTYATREWCREEVLLAKEHQRPVVVVDALSGHEVRSFPYLGNVPRLRWDGDPQKGIDLLLKETLRQLYDLVRLGQFKQPGDFIFARPPELATLVGRDPKLEILYPDPPVGVSEAKRLAKAGIKVSTPFQRLAITPSLRGQPVSLSMSESTDIAECGLDAMHLESCMLDLSRYLLIKGATLAYGGHLGAEGYTQKLFELVRTHNSVEGVQPFERIVNHRGWPLPRLSVKDLSALNRVSKTVELPRPAEVEETLHSDFTREPKFFPGDKSAEHRFAWARGMTEMRAFQADRTQSGVVARIVVGGTFGPTVKVLEDGTRKEQWYASRIPGVLEEIVLSVQVGQPVFLIGAFGGVAKLVIDLLRGENREEATWDYQKRAPFADEMKALYQKHGVPWLDYPEIVALIRDKGLSGINPLLTTEEHTELFETIDQGRIIEIVLLGLSRLDLPVTPDK
ncbi:toll/interleukin-1 receptor domain-containing protein [Phragmitibacter flavus]|uniref:Toll/interleukin-1 receptor domain-containing protein n=1 Tax=Phragmitibacter flavus TaxID=2576071 RepID=A0A5R8KHH0_9BACT|nr:TIR domain-containing protein [Phragmitibacter flavus]TLD71690.1 toll/interleukin-1 receptor domain-containing protein [Phragmitibacter flavus]